ncbi:MAG: hypothetical protein O7E54_06680, partial [Planctomycetota bacterium]|nr:hypothetical protein [Planctomycetota bacterium]
MIQHRPRRGPEDGPDAPPAPWTREAAGISFCALWTTGPDTTLDSVFRLLAMRAGESGKDRAWRVFDATCDPFPAEQDASPTATARMAREYGVTRSDLVGAREHRE